MKKSFFFGLLLLLATGCHPSAAPNVGQAIQPVPAGQSPGIEVDVRGTAQAEATAILEAARATAIIWEAQAAATALLQQNQDGWLGEEPVITLSSADLQRQERLPTPQPYLAPTNENTAVLGNGTASVQILKVEIGGEGGFIVVNYTSSYQEAQNFWPGRVWVEDEGTGTTYNEVPVMPIIGPLIARPQQDGQPGYVMFVNNPPLYPGASVTVGLDTFTQEHIPVQ